MNLVNKNWILRQLLDQKIKEISTSLKVKEIRASNYESAYFAEFSLFFSGENDKKQKIYAFIRCELHLVEIFRANILISKDILTLESFLLNVGLGHTVVKSCRVKITIKVR